MLREGKAKPHAKTEEAAQVDEGTLRTHLEESIRGLNELMSVAGGGRVLRGR